MRQTRINTAVFAAALSLMAMTLALGPQRAAAAETRTVCSDIPWPPFEIGSGGDKAYGFDIDVMRSVAAIQGYDIEIQNLAFDSIIPAVRTDKCDIGASGFTITEKRDQAVDFSDPYYVSNQAIVTRKGGDMNSITAMAGMGPNGKVGAQRGTTGAGWVKDNLANNGVDVELKLYETYPLAISDLVNGRIDAVIQDAPASKSSVAAYPDKLTVAGMINTYEYFGFISQEGDPKGLLAKINEGVSKLGLKVVDTAAGTELSVQPDSPWAHLNAAYFGPDKETITAAWDECKGDILNAESMADVERYAKCMAQEAE